MHIDEVDFGVTLTEAEVRAGGSDGLRRGLDRGDIYIDEAGYYFFKRRVKTDTQ